MATSISAILGGLFPGETAGLGGLVQRMESAGRRMNLFADGTLDDIEELSVEKLPLATYKDGKIGMVLRWKDITPPSSVL